MRQREENIELLRLLLAVGITGIHCANTSGYPIGWLFNSLLWCVDGFAFISGWYGAKFRLSKILRLWGIGLACATLGVCSKCLMQSQWTGWWIDIWRIFCEYWFLHAYVFMLFFSQFVDCLFDAKRSPAQDRKVLQALLPLLFLCFGWSYVGCLPWIRDLRYPVTAGLGTYTGLTLIGVYAFARAVRYFDLQRKVRAIHLIGLVVVGWCLSVAGLGEYNSPVAAVLSFAIFLLFQKIHLTGRIVAALSPSAFAVYLIQDPWCKRGIVLNLQHHLVGLCSNRYLIWLISTIIVVAGCLILDIPRRVIAKANLFSRIMRGVDCGYDWIVAKIESVLLENRVS